MKVEVSKIKRPGVKVSVTLARSRRKGSCITIPVRPAAQSEGAPENEVIVSNAEREPTVIGFAPGAEDEFDVVAEAVEETDCDVVSEDAPIDVSDEEVLDEEDLIALIEEEEAEMASQLHQQDDVSDSVCEDVFADEPADEPEDLLTDQTAFVSEDVSAEEITEDTEEVSEAEPADDTVEADAADGHPDQPAQVEQYMRYFDRSTDGEKFEVSDTRANGQEIIGVDGGSGRLSRVCGFIKHNQSAQSSGDEQPDEQPAEQE